MADDDELAERAKANIEEAEKLIERLKRVIREAASLMEQSKQCPTPPEKRTDHQRSNFPWQLRWASEA
jgi:hypothetical protein